MDNASTLFKHIRKRHKELSESFAGKMVRREERRLFADIDGLEFRPYFPRPSYGKRREINEVNQMFLKLRSFINSVRKISLI